MAATLPSFVTSHAPLVWLHQNEAYFPSDLSAHVQHTIPEVNFTAVAGAPSPLTLDNLDSLNILGDQNVFLTATEQFPTNATWLRGVAPESSGNSVGTKSCVIIVNDHGSGIVDAFYHYFYSYNLGAKVFGREYGNHVGDWEHTMIRFNDGNPEAMWFSQHSFGAAYQWNATEKQGQRPYAYSAIGTHANWPNEGRHVHDGIVPDYTSKGELWDPLLSSWAYSYDAATTTLTPYDNATPTAYLNFVGQWGDKQYNDSYSGQYAAFGQHHYVDGPRGPRDKQLNRTNVCPDGRPCIVQPFILHI